MKRHYHFLFTILILLFCNTTYSQNITAFPVDTIIKTHDLNTQQWHVWDSISNYWLKNEYTACLKKNNLKLSCGHCESIYLVVNLYINNDGKLSKYDIVKDKVCGSKATTKLKNCFLNYFNTIVFPPPLRNINIQAHLGNGLKC